MSDSSCPPRGYFITLEGVDGGGKTTQMNLLVPRLRAGGLSVLALREPGGTSVGEAIRRLLLDPAQEVCPQAETLLYAAARAELVHRRVLPALEAGQVVVLERFLDSSLAYQAYGLGLAPREVLAANALAVGDLRPNLTILFDIDPRQARRNRLSGDLDRIERREEAYHGRVREGFLALARAEPERFRIVDASQSIETVHEVVWKLVVEGLAGAGIVFPTGEEAAGGEVSL